MSTEPPEGAPVAEAGSLDVPAMREWQKRVVGDALLRALR